MNLEWTSEPPSQPGPHFWRPDATAQVVLHSLTRLDGLVMAYTPEWKDEEGYYTHVDEYGGEWVRLIPASELIAAHAEGVAGIDWESSRAKQVAEGLA